MKCGQYWPQDVEGIEQYENFVVINNGVETQENYIESILLLQNLEVAWQVYLLIVFFFYMF